MIENLWEQFQHSAHLSEGPNTSVREDRLFSKQYQFWVLNFIHTGTFLLTSVSDQNCRVELSNTQYCFSAKQDIHGISIKGSCSYDVITFGDPEIPPLCNTVIIWPYPLCKVVIILTYFPEMTFY